MKYVFLDQAMINTGFSVFEDQSLVRYGNFHSSIKDDKSIERMNEMYFWIKDLILEENPDCVVIESVQYQQNQLRYSQLSQMQGVLFALFFELDIRFKICASSTWRSYCGIKIKDKKRKELKLDAIRFVKEKYNIDVLEDTAEAILMGFGIVNNIDFLKD